MSTSSRKTTKPQDEKKPAKKQAAKSGNNQGNAQPPESKNSDGADSADNDMSSKDTDQGSAPATEPDKPVKEGKKSALQERVEKLIALNHELAAEGKKLTHRRIIKHIGCTFSTAAKLQVLVEKLTVQQIDIEAVVSETIVDAIKAEIVRNIEAYQEAIQEKLDLIADCEKALDLAIELLESIIATFNESIDD